jgi:sec-independent protein translocase protein TatB
MFGMGMGELIVILVIALLFLGPEKLPEAAKAISKGMRELRKQTRAVQETLEQDETLSSTVRDLRSALTGDDYRPTIRPPAQAPMSRNAEPAPLATLPAPAASEPSPPADPASASAPVPADKKEA